jgi:hypothetical protein
MKTLIIFLFVVATAALSRAQEVTNLKEVNLSFAPLNTEIIKTPKGFTFSIANVRSHVFARDPIGFMYENFNIKSFIATLEGEKHDSHEVSLRTRGGAMLAIFDKVGNLISTRQNFKNVALSHPMILKVYKDYKGWIMTKNKYSATTEGEVITKEVYRITLQKGKRKQRVKIVGDNTGINIASN